MASMPIGTLNPSLPLADAGGKPDNARIHEVARKLEGQFAQMMIKCMREAGFGDSLFPGENQIFRDMYDQQIATAMSQGRGLGRQLLREAERRARAGGAARLELTSGSQRTDAHAFYKACGYEDGTVRFIKRLGTA